MVMILPNAYTKYKNDYTFYLCSCILIVFFKIYFAWGEFLLFNVENLYPDEIPYNTNLNLPIVRA